ncbi:SH3 domain-containing protein [Pantanalinema sp. GBBB05]|uniref:SH3 domain-containing protein n=1 Tax=Pantanalinema sp. GBBB05 TaxID=2604139 RepID=UPI001E1312DC|nr:SH3 domain-containing protein [Pantanalinema sp. GBBB05]
MRQSNIVRALSGFLLAIALIVGGGYLTTQFVIAKFTELPPRPTFPNDKPSPNPATSAAAKTVTNQPKTSPAVAVSPSPTPTPSTTPSPKSDGNVARIALGEGLNVRENPSVEAGRVGGVDYNEVVVVLETSPDQEWQKIRVEKSGLEGWIKSGYTEPVSQTAE